MNSYDLQMHWYDFIYVNSYNLRIHIIRIMFSSIVHKGYFHGHNITRPTTRFEVTCPMMRFEVTHPMTRFEVTRPTTRFEVTRPTTRF